MAVPNTCLKIYQVDAFAAKVFEGNPAAVIPLTGPDWPGTRKNASDSKREQPE